MMDRQLENKTRLDTLVLRKKINNLVDDDVARIGNMETHSNEVSGKTKDDLTTWLAESKAQLGNRVEKMTSETKMTTAKSAEEVKRDVANNLSHFNAKAQKLAKKVPGNFGIQIARYPWVAITFAMVTGFLLGRLFRPAPKFFENFLV